MESQIKLLAEARGYKTPEALSKDLKMTRATVKMTRATVANIWTGDVRKRQFETMFAVARLLNVPMEDLVTINE
jgi:DNA-binding Xre family transcriptional regulator